jgi:hypothetical protein
MKRNFPKVDRRSLILGGLASLYPLQSNVSAAPAENSSSLQVFYSDDVTHITTNLAPWRRNREPFSDALLTAGMDEAINAGADHYVLQPGLGWVPWWHSRIYPADEHYRWFSETFGTRPNGFGRYMIEGGDMVRTALNHAKRRKISLTVSIRLNDQHAVLYSGVTPQTWRSLHDSRSRSGAAPRGLDAVSRVHMERLDWRLDTAPPDFNDRRSRWKRLWNWAVPEVVDYRASLLEELIRSYQIDGLELDYMRYPMFFQEATPVEQRIEIMRGFINRIRAALDRNGRPQNGAPRCELALRVPLILSGWRALGLTPEMLRETGVDRVTLSANTFTSQDLDFSAAREALKGIRLALEVSYAKHLRQNRIGQPARDGTSEEEERLLLCQPEDFVSTAQLAVQSKFDAISFFNFVYYRSSAGKPLPFTADNEPPWEVMRQVKAPFQAKVRRNCWFLGVTHRYGIATQSVPAGLQPGGPPAVLRLNVGPLAEGAQSDGWLRLAIADQRSGADPAAGTAWQVSLNGQDLTMAGPDNPDAVPQEDAGAAFISWRVPRGGVKSGENRLMVRQTHGDRSRIWLVELYS